MVRLPISLLCVSKKTINMGMSNSIAPVIRMGMVASVLIVVLAIWNMPSATVGCDGIKMSGV